MVTNTGIKLLWWRTSCSGGAVDECVTAGINRLSDDDGDVTPIYTSYAYRRNFGGIHRGIPTRASTIKRA